jgi:hypothetical protein
VGWSPAIDQLPRLDGVDALHSTSGRERLRAGGGVRGWGGGGGGAVVRGGRQVR